MPQVIVQKHIIYLLVFWVFFFFCKNNKTSNMKCNLLRKGFLQFKGMFQTEALGGRMILKRNTEVRGGTCAVAKNLLLSTCNVPCHLSQIVGCICLLYNVSYPFTGNGHKKALRSVTWRHCSLTWVKLLNSEQSTIHSEVVWYIYISVWNWNCSFFNWKNTHYKIR